MLVELKNGETYNGILVNCDIWMNLSLRDVVCTSRVRAERTPADTVPRCILRYDSLHSERGG